MLSNIFEIHIKVKPRHQKDPKLLKLKHSERAKDMILVLSTMFPRLPLEIYLPFS